MNPKFKVLVQLDVRYHAARRMIAGILRFAATHEQWDLMMQGNHPSNDGFKLDPNWRPDGVISDGSWRTSRSALFTGLASHNAKSQPLRGIVFANCIPPKRCRVPHATIRTDERAIAVAAAELFRHHGFANFAFVGPRVASRWSDARLRFFRAALSDAGCGRPFVYKSPNGADCAWSKEIAALTDFIRSLPFPCGIWAAYDQRAKHVLDICRHVGIDVPKQVQVLGVDNETYICEQTIPPLSSVTPDFESGGYMAAETLNALMCGERAVPRTVKMPLVGVTERLSTMDFSRAGSRTNQACAYIRQHAGEDISVSAVVKAVGGSERLLEKNFRTVLGHSICREIQNQRLEHVKQLLKDSSLPIEILSLRCGYKNANYLKNLFRKRMGMSMSEYRLQARSPS